MIMGKDHTDLDEFHPLFLELQNLFMLLKIEKIRKSRNYLETKIKNK